MGKGGDIFGNSPNPAWSFDEVRWPRNRFAGPFTAFRATEMRDPVDAELGTSILPNSKFAACRRLPVSNLGF
jgi:hypothetical protein